MGFDAFMSIKDSNNKLIAGESTDQAYGGASEVLEFSFTSESRPAGGSITGRSIQVVEDAVSTGPTVSLTDTKSPPKEVHDHPPTKFVLNRVQVLESKCEKEINALSTRINAAAGAVKVVADNTAELEQTMAQSAQPGPSDAKDDQDTKKRKSRLKVDLKKYLDSASPYLLKAYCHQASGYRQTDKYEPFKSVDLHLRKAGGSEPLVYLKIGLKEVDVLSYTLDSGSGTELPTEGLTLGCQEFTVEYSIQTAAGLKHKSKSPTILGWNFEENKPAP